MFRKIILLVVALLLVPVAYMLLRKDLTLPKADVKAAYSLPNSHFIPWKGGELHYTESGSDSNMTVLMIHGFGGSNRDFQPLDSLINQRYRVIRVDLPGFGLSDYPFAYGSGKFRDAYSEYFNFMLDTLHIDSCYVMGNSLGGLMALELTSQHAEKVKKLVLFNSAGYDMEEVMKSANAHVFQNPLVQYFAQKGMPEFMTNGGISRVTYADTLLTPVRVKRVNSMWNRQGNLAHIVAMANAKEPLDEQLIRNISCPTLIVWGQQDQIINIKYAERFHKDIAGSHLFVLDSCGHVPMLEKPLAVQHEVLTFFGDI